MLLSKDAAGWPCRSLYYLYCGMTSSSGTHLTAPMVLLSNTIIFGMKVSSELAPGINPGLNTLSVWTRGNEAVGDRSIEIEIMN